ncbi:MAG: hypothetical protein MK135_15600, partial [Polyangiaceae bacterium]|nr:hypothetical protein [Polyangiaceae bacterium]
MTDLFSAANEWISQQLGSTSGAASYLWLLFGGILASLLPCVYPIYPITAALLSARKSAISPVAHPLAYYLGLAGIYFCFGIIASITGGAFNEALRLPLTQLIIAALLFSLALATMGYLHFPVLQGKSGESEANQGQLHHTFLMGVAAGFLSSACVGPIVVSILISIAAQSEAISFLQALTAASKMLAFGAGLGLPFLLIGVFGVALPRSGSWMLKVQIAFVLLIGYFALGYAIKGLEGLELQQDSVAIIFSTALVFVASYGVQSKELPQTEKTRIALCATGALIGACALFNLTTNPASAASP